MKTCVPVQFYTWWWVGGQRMKIVDASYVDGPPDPLGNLVLGCGHTCTLLLRFCTQYIVLFSASASFIRCGVMRVIFPDFQNNVAAHILYFLQLLQVVLG